ncbi:cyclic-di-AMP-binding protein CbpB [Bacillus sp. CGMCC 1.16541]|uniref:cyclic-di-AMP-binding protein CbpB n=1 Tax=Bacillus sp. CGMCC 1.16541 TaxID=2185143 RepID=UPI000D72E226|nr:cyclic-di-AMP-binding protein CbpB [Bacillus sp. CGMCC 1.16541]
MNTPYELFDCVSIEDLLVRADKVAHVQVGNNLEHALLVLTKTGYTAVPVLNPSYKLQGLVSTTLILDSILGLERIEFERLEERKVESVMKKDVPRMKVGEHMNQALHLMINHPFVCVENEHGVFEGILTRRSILQHVQKDLLRKQSTKK